MSYAQPAAPASGDRFDPKNHPEWMGALFLIWPTKVNDAKQWDPKYEASETVSADMVILDRVGPDGQPVVLKDTMVFGQVLVAQFKENLRLEKEPVVLGRLEKKITNNGFEAWSLASFNPGVDDVAADAYVASHPRNQFRQPSGQQGPPVPSAGPPPFGAAQSGPTGWDAAGAQAPAQQQWGASAAPVPPPTPPAEQWPAGLREFLQSKGIDPVASGMTVDAAKNLASTFQ